jgi:hypothetical protein
MDTIGVLTSMALSWGAARGARPGSAMCA